MHVYQFTHTDLDGAGCAVVANFAFRNQVAEVTPVATPEVLNNKLRTWLSCRSSLPKDDKIFLLITDVAPTAPDVCTELTNAHNSKEIVVLCADHHKRSTHEVREAPWLAHSVHCCGSKLLYLSLRKIETLWKRLEPDIGELAAFIDAVDAYDLWRLDDPARERGEKLNRLKDFMGFERFVKTFSEQLSSDEVGEFSKVMPILQEEEKRVVEDTVSGQMPAMLCTAMFNYKYAIFFAQQYHSQVAMEALGRLPDIDFVAIVNPTVGAVSLRSRKGSGIDVTEIAKRHGGGGHVNGNTAGFPRTITQVIEDINYGRLI